LNGSTEGDWTACLRLQIKRGMFNDVRQRDGFGFAAKAHKAQLWKALSELDFKCR
jgi:hypothetical protein